MTRDTHRVGEEVTKAQSGQVADEFQSCKVTLTGASVAFTFASANLPDMADTAYRVFLEGQTVSDLKCTEASIATTGFTITGGLNAEVAHILVHGKVAGRKTV